MYSKSKLSQRVTSAPSDPLSLASQSEYQYSFLDNSLSIALLHEFNTQSTRVDNPPLDMRCLLVRPPRTGKTFFGKMWLEFMKGDPDNLLERTQLKQQYGHLFPNPHEFVCVYLDFSGASMESLAGYLIGQLNLALNAANQLVSLSDDLTDPIDIIERFCSLLEECNAKAALFVDEYDVLARESLVGFQFTTDFLEKLKQEGACIPYCYLTGTTRLSVAVAYYIRDLSYDGEWATTLGYTWDQIVSLYGPQLRRLCECYRVSLEQLKARMEYWYSGYHFSSELGPSVYSVCAVHHFLQSGKFEHHSSPTALSKVFMKPIYVAVFLSIMTDSKIRYKLSDLKGYRYFPLKERLSIKDLHMLLLADGVLSIYPLGDDNVELRVPNMDATSRITSIIQKSLQTRD